MRHWVRDNKWSVVTIAGLLVLNGVLIGLLVLRPRIAAPAEPSSLPRASDSTSTTANPPGSSSPSAAPSMPRTPTAGARPGRPSTRLLAISSSVRGWRATVGSCTGRGAVQVTNDGGRTWLPVTSPRLSPITRIDTARDGTVFAIGGARDTCRAQYKFSTTTGRSWDTRDSELAGSWYRTTRNPKGVRTPAGERSRPCGGDVRDLAVVDREHAAVLCSDGTVRLSQDSGRSWQRVSAPDETVALARRSRGYVAATVTDSCDGLGLWIINGIGQPGAGGTTCVPVTAVDPTDVAIASAGNTIWVWAGPEFRRSVDGGRNWLS